MLFVCYFIHLHVSYKIFMIIVQHNFTFYLLIFQVEQCIHNTVCQAIMTTLYFIFPASRPTMTELLQLNIPQMVKANYYRFGVILLNDQTGHKMVAIEKGFGEDPERITRAVLGESLKQLERPWENIVWTLRQCDMSNVADLIEIAREYNFFYHAV